KPKKLVFHSGFLPNVYYKEWFVDRAILFLKEFIKDKDIEICLENVFSDEPSFIYDIVSKVDSDRLKICLDIGHINAYGDKTCKDEENACIKYWIDKLYPYISHFHIHNNNGMKDTHNDVYDGDIDIKDIIMYAITKIEVPTFTVEVMNIKDFPDFIDKICNLS
ncbi:MAG: sugar phosphate isomerase/epimerase, partial [Lachnospiraceae bacterium]|nr:sugar phosphate isomerase/epimerase [Lachnospiraceae bacterium]